MTEGADFDARLGAALREARLNAGYTQEEIARVLRVTPATIARYELGVRHLSASMLLQIATALDISLSRLVPGQIDSNAQPCCRCRRLRSSRQCRRSSGCWRSILI
jgi:transcriptional regulator with XRE-family HTH domain